MKSLKYLFLLLLCCFVFELSAQRNSDNDEYFDEGGAFAQNLWFGAGGSLGYSGNNFRSIFNIGISPMVGYKVIPNLSIGPRVGVTYLSQRFNSGNGIFRFNSWNFEYGVFARYRVIPVVFVHVEYGQENIGFTDGTIKPGSNNELNKFRESIPYTYVGAGYQSEMGGVWGYEFALLFDLQDDPFDGRPPFFFRGGINYNF